MLESERKKLLNLEEDLHRRVIGQDEAITAIADTIRRSHEIYKIVAVRLAPLFLWEPGVGKTELAKLWQKIFQYGRCDDSIDMSEFQERHSVSRLIGSPPGYDTMKVGNLPKKCVENRIP